MIEIEKPRIDALDLAPDGTYGKFVVEPLGAGLRHDVGQQPAPCAALLPARRGRYVR